MTVDWVTVVVRAAISAVVGAVVSLIAVHGQTVRRMRAETSETARRTIREALAPTRLEVRRYRLDRSREAGPKRKADTAHGDDLVLTTTVVNAAEGFGAIRRHLFGLRSRRVFGREFYRIASMHHPDDAASSTSLMMVAMIRGIDQTGNPIIFTDGLLHRALASSPTSPLVRKLDRHITRLARGW